MMNLANLGRASLALSLIIFSLSIFGTALAAGPLLIAYGGHNETMARCGWALKRVCSESTVSIPRCCRPAADRS